MTSSNYLSYLDAFPNTKSPFKTSESNSLLGGNPRRFLGKTSLYSYRIGYFFIISYSMIPSSK